MQLTESSFDLFGGKLTTLYRSYSVASPARAAYATNVQLCSIRLCALLLCSTILCVTGCRTSIPPAAQLQPATVQLVSSNDDATVTDIRFPSPSLGTMLWYRAVVPKVAPGERLPVLYFLPGGAGDPPYTQEQSSAMHYAIATRLIVITPNPGTTWYTNAKHKQLARWEDAVAFDLVRDVDSRFPTLTERKHRGLAGLSMGGYGAVKLALKYPERYAFAASMSGSFDVTRRWPNLFNPAQSWDEWMIFGFRPSTRLDEDIYLLLDHAPNPQAVKWFAACGTDDSLSSDNTKLLQQLRARGAATDTVATAGKHNWPTWRIILPQLYKDAAAALH